jgi:hypothetical protein
MILSYLSVDDIFTVNVLFYGILFTSFHFYKDFKGMMFKLHVTMKFWMCQKSGKMKDLNKKMTTSGVE